MIVERFFENVEFSDSGCWIWTGGKYDGRYGSFWVSGASVRAHHFSFEQFVGPLLWHQVVIHECDTPLCVRPCHLRAGSQAENVADMIAKRRAHWMKESE